MDEPSENKAQNLTAEPGWTVPVPEKGRGIIDFIPFKTTREKKCEICGFSEWDTHHIIDLRDGGDHCDENIILLCPNHHRLVHRGKLQLSQKGKICSAYYVIQEFATFWMSINDKSLISDEDRDKFIEYNKKYGFDKDHAIAYWAGISRKELWNTYTKRK